MLQLNGNTDLTGNLLWFVAVATIAFLVSWFLTERMGFGRTSYVGALAVVTGAVTAGYLFWSGLGVEFWTNDWTWGLVGAGLTATFLTLLLSRMIVPSASHPKSVGLAQVVWDAVVYGAAEGLLLSVLPVVIVWQAAMGQNVGAIGSGALALAASLVVIVVHHLGYADFRGKKMRQALIGCVPLSLAYLLTGSPIAAMVAHMVLHYVAIRRGMELPPAEPIQAKRIPARVATVS
jgi:hypothetical protein